MWGSGKTRIPIQTVHPVRLRFALQRSTVRQRYAIATHKAEPQPPPSIASEASVVAAPRELDDGRYTVHEVLGNGS